MLDPFGPSTAKLDAAIRSQAENQLAIITILIEKGLCTPEEFEAARIKAISTFDQMVAESRAAADPDGSQAKAEEFLSKILGDKP